MQTRKTPDSTWVQAGDALSPLLQRLAAQMSKARAHACETRSGAAEREAAVICGERSRRKAGDDGAV